MSDITFNDTQKSAIVSLLVEMINADRHVDPTEVEMFNSICAELHINEDIYRIGIALNSMVALDMMRRMNDQQKIKTACMLVRVIDADANDDDREIHLFYNICHYTGVDVLIDNLAHED